MQPKPQIIFVAIEERFVADDMPWNNCFSLSVDSTNTMIGITNYVASRGLGKNNEICIAGCLYHLAHIAAVHANDGFSNYINLNIEDICVDAFYWFDKSKKHKGKLVEYFEFYDQQYQSMLKHLIVRWLSLECRLVRILKKFRNLPLHFVNEYFRDERFRRLND